MDKFKVTQFESGPPWVPGLNSSGGSHIPNIRQFSDTSNVFQNSTQFGHYLPKIESVPQVKSLVLQDRISIPHFRHQSQAPSCYLCFQPMGWRMHFPTTFSLDFCNLPGQLTETRKMLTYVYQFMKGYEEIIG